MKRYNSIDLLKVILAIFVVAIHTDPLPEGKYSIYEMIINSAVPCFLMISSFLIFMKNDDNNKAIQKHLKKIIKLYILWTIIYLPISLFFMFKLNESITITFLRFIKDFIFVGQQAYSYQLWYLLSTIYCLSIVYFFKKRKIKDSYLICLSIVLFLLGLWIDGINVNNNLTNSLLLNIQFFLKHTFGSGRMFYSLLYICIGMYFSKIYKHIRIQHNAAIFAIFVILNFFIENTIIYIFLYIFIFTSFLMLKLKDNKIYGFLRKLSTVMYFTHMIFFFIYTLYVGENNCKGLFGFLFTIICTVLTSVIIYFLEKKYPNNKITNNIF